MDTSWLSTPGVSESRHGRKKLRMEQNWKRKLGKDRGEAYITYKGEAKLPKTIRPITCYCVFNCRRKVTKTDRKQIFESFYALESHDEQNKYLYGLIEKKEIGRC